MKNAVDRGAKGGQPVMRLRSMFIGLCALAVCVAGPLVLVWKQSYINQASIRLECRADTLASLNREITALKLEYGSLTSAPRVERIARARGFDYPVSGQLEVLEVGAPRQRKEGGIAGFFAHVMQSLLGERG